MSGITTLEVWGVVLFAFLMGAIVGGLCVYVMAGDCECEP